MPGGSPPTAQQPLVLAKVKQRILRGEFVDFDLLQPEALYPTKHGAGHSQSISLWLSMDSAEGDMVIAQPKPMPCRAIRDFPSWMEAWNFISPSL